MRLINREELKIGDILTRLSDNTDYSLLDILHLDDTDKKIKVPHYYFKGFLVSKKVIFKMFQIEDNKLIVE